MTRTAEAYINPALLVWARETVGYSAEELAAKLHLSVDKIAAWELGLERPSIAKLKHVSNVLKRPLASFYLPEPPNDRRPPKDFRGLIEGHAGHFSPKLRMELRLAELRRDDALNLIEELEEKPVDFTFKASLKDDPEDVANALLNFLDLTTADIAQCRDEYNARKTWKTCVENKGVLVFQATGVDISEM